MKYKIDFNEKFVFKAEELGKGTHKISAEAFFESFAKWVPRACLKGPSLVPLPEKIILEKHFDNLQFFEVPDEIFVEMK